MQFQDLPTEIIDHVFETYITLLPDKTLLPLMLTCSQFHQIAQRRHVQHVLLTSNRSIVSFAQYLEQVCKKTEGSFPSHIIPIQSLAVFGSWESLQYTGVDNLVDQQSATAFCAISQIAAPTLQRLLVYRIGHYDRRGVGTVVDLSTKFPVLRELVALEQSVISISQVTPYLHNVNRLYIGCSYQEYHSFGDGVFPSLKQLRMEYTKPNIYIKGNNVIDIPNIQRLDTFIVDVNRYQHHYHRGVFRTRFPEDVYNNMLERLEKATEGKGGLVIGRIIRESATAQILVEGWSECVRGGRGFWTTEWTRLDTQTAY